jgi:prefoldin subunit 5
MSKKKNWEKVLTDSWVNNNSGLTLDEAKQKIIDCQFDIKNTLYEKENDDQLNAAKEIVKDLGAGYNAAVKYEKAKIDFLLERIEALRALSKEE